MCEKRLFGISMRCDGVLVCCVTFAGWHCGQALHHDCKSLTIDGQKYLGVISFFVGLWQGVRSRDKPQTTDVKRKTERKAG